MFYRYVDDIFCIVKRSDLNRLLKTLNEQYESINFTYEEEREGKLAFLDLMLCRKNDRIDIAVHHKPTSTMRYITADSHTPIQHKKAAFHSMIHRLVKLPLSLSNYNIEYNHILTVAKRNGYRKKMIDDIIVMHTKKVTRTNQTTVFSQNSNDNNNTQLKRVCVSFVPSVTNKIKSVFKRFGMELVYSNNNKIKQMLGSTKDKTPTLEKSGIYKIECSDCDKRYYGQTKRNINVRFKDHMNYIAKNQPRKSALANHILFNDHNVSKEKLTMKKQINDPNKLDAYESYFIQKTQTQ